MSNVPERVDDSSEEPEQSCAFDEDYIRRLAEGDHSIEDHFSTYFGGLLTIKLRARLRSRDLIDDIRQETFTRVLHFLRRKGTLRQPDRLGAFVNRVCDNVILEKFREDRRFTQMNSEFDWADRRINLDRPLINRECMRLVESVLAELQKRDREVLRLVFLEELSSTEASARLGVGEDYLRVLLHRAKSRFREKLAERGAPGNVRFLSGIQQDPVKRKRWAVHYTMRYSDGT